MNSNQHTMTFRLMSIVVIVCAFAARDAAAIQAYAIQDFNVLVAFDTSAPELATTTPFSGATNQLDGLDFRASNGLLYGYVQSSNQLVTVDPTTAVTTFVSNPSTPSTSNDLGIDFNPVADRLRVVNANDENLRINVDTGATIVDGTLAYIPGDVNFGVNPNINEAAYLNNDIDPGTTTALYFIDYVADDLVVTTNPNAGELTTVGSLGVDTEFYTGFDIFTAGGVNTAYAILTEGNNAPGLYTINLSTGAASFIGTVGDGGIAEIYGLAIVPEPSSPTLLLAAGLAFATCRGKRRENRGQNYSSSGPRPNANDQCQKQF
jgi:hypothetical protein